MDEEQFEFIKRVIDDCDYYILIIGGRYGSTSEEGISYTEKEYDYAVQKKIKVLAFIHAQPDEIASGKTDKNEDSARRLTVFRDKVATNRLVKFWNSATELPAMVQSSLLMTMKMFPAVGWIRGDSSASAAVLEEINKLRKENEDLRLRIGIQANNPVSTNRPDNLAGLDHVIEVFLRFWDKEIVGMKLISIKISFADIFFMITPLVEVNAEEKTIKDKLKKDLFRLCNVKSSVFALAEDSFQIIKAQFILLDLISANLLPVIDGENAIFWIITEKGKLTVLEKHAVRIN